VSRGLAFVVAVVAEIIGIAGAQVIGGIVVTVGIGAIWWWSSRMHPRMRHRACKGTGEVRSWLLPWVFHRCPNCTSGRVVRWGAGHFGAQYAQAEYRKAKATRAAAKENHRSR